MKGGLRKTMEQIIETMVRSIDRSTIFHIPELKSIVPAFLPVVSSRHLDNLQRSSGQNSDSFGCSR